uniref:Uncharacterized protein n=1 Tax=Lotharella globosa TaxID=91324 RepID=A0A7S3YX03_9EUKA
MCAKAPRHHIYWRAFFTPHTFFCCPLVRRRHTSTFVATWSIPPKRLFPPHARQVYGGSPGLVDYPTPTSSETKANKRDKAQTGYTCIVLAIIILMTNAVL